MKKIFQLLVFSSLLFLHSVVCAQLRIEIAGIGGQQIPVAIVTFANVSVTPAPITEILKNDLLRSGYFQVSASDQTISEAHPVNGAEWKEKGVDAVVTGSVQKLSDGRYTVRYKLWDAVKGAQLSGVSFTSANYRLLAHKIADDVFEKLTGAKGIFSTRVAYITQAGKEYRLEIADADGEGRVVALRSTQPLISPVWSPDGTKVAYVSFENKKPAVYVQNLATRERRLLANYKGSNSAPAWSPDGKRLALALAYEGLTQIYLVNADGAGLRRLTHSVSIDTEPQFAPDGKTIYFTSDRSSTPQIYRMNADIGDSTATRVTFGSDYNISPRLSPDGKYLAYISRRDGKYSLFVQDLESAQEQLLSSTNKDEAPSFSPNGKYILYATEVEGRGVLGMVSVDGRVKQRITIPVGDVREPTWGPLNR